MQLNVLNDLKAKAYDILATIEAHQREIQKLQQTLQSINGEIIKLSQEDSKDNVKEIKKAK